MHLAKAALAVNGVVCVSSGPTTASHAGRLAKGGGFIHNASAARSLVATREEETDDCGRRGAVEGEEGRSGPSVENPVGEVWLL